MDTYIVDEEKAGIRIDKAIGLIEDTLSRVAIQRLLDEGNILVNGKITKASYKTKLGDGITIQKETPKKVNIIAQDIPLFHIPQICLHNILLNLQYLKHHRKCPFY